jgi:molybdate transport system permease protein
VAPRPSLTLAFALAAALLVALLALPIVALVVRVSPAALLARLGSPEALEALRLSAIATASATALVVVLGLPTAWLLATREFRGKRAVELLLQLPMVLPPTVAGLALLMAFGRAGLAGGALSAFGVTLPFTLLGVIVAQAFMAAPFFVNVARAGFAALDPELLDAAATLRAGEGRTLWSVAIPLAMPALVAGAAMACARALGEFGATITFAGNMAGITQTLPLAVYVALQTDLEAALAMAVLLVIVSVALLLALRAGAGPLAGGVPHADRRRRAPLR